MKTITILIIGISLCMVCHSAAFRNLDFQSPNIRILSIPKPGGEHQVHDVIPGWRLQVAEQNRDWMFYNNISLLFPSAQLLGPKVPRIGDEFTFTINSGIIFDGFKETMGTASIYQIGQVPESAKSIHFRALMLRISDNLHVSLDGQVLQFQRFADGDEGDFFGYEADVSDWAGKTAELRFTVGPGDYPRGAGGPLADIEFSSIPVAAIPEPSTWALLATGLAAVGWVTRNSKQRPAN